MAKGAKTGGRAAGTPNKATKEFRETVTKLLEKNAPNVGLWLQRVADGVPDVVNDQGDVIMKGAQADPGKALDLLAKLAEYAAPKLNRVEHVGEGGGPMQHQIEMVIVDARDDQS